MELFTISRDFIFAEKNVFKFFLVGLATFYCFPLRGFLLVRDIQRSKIFW